MVEDVTLSYTILRTAGGERIVIPNEKLAAGVLRNDIARRRAAWPSRSTSGSRRTPTPARAVALLQEETGAT